jgi:hypothetical protein
MVAYLSNGWACLIATHLYKNVISAKAEIQESLAKDMIVE